VKQRLHVVHVAASAIPEGSQLNVAKPGVENTIELEVRGSIIKGREIACTLSINERERERVSTFSQSMSGRETGGEAAEDPITSSATERGYIDCAFYLSSHPPPPPCSLVQVNVPEFSEAISVLNLIGDIYFFSGLSLSHARGLLEVGFKKRYAAGEIIVGKDSPITDFCVLLVGLLEVTYDEDPENEPYKVHIYPFFS
jgi:hypothetical protein